ncbi:unnamed protein product [Mytilus coruscus]|uniref:Retrotransposon gag domain-containing protein n=1 Tax=Mytilus coruscus TaxID=42192 RepID=A0A6J8A132_MYTCO|nr:unnamed protein product [Mytilus coruscus]
MTEVTNNQCVGFRPVFSEEYLKSQAKDVTKSRNNLKCAFLKKYEFSSGQNFQTSTELINISQREEESLSEYINRLHILSEVHNYGEQFTLWKLRNKCKPELMQQMAFGKWPETVAEAENRLRSVEATSKCLQEEEQKRMQDNIVTELRPEMEKMLQQISAVNSKALQQPSTSLTMVEPLLNSDDDCKAKVQHRTRTPR